MRQTAARAKGWNYDFFDNAATSYHKPPAVYRAVRDACASVRPSAGEAMRRLRRPLRVFMTAAQSLPPSITLANPENIILPIMPPLRSIWRSKDFCTTAMLSFPAMNIMLWYVPWFHWTVRRHLYGGTGAAL